MEMHHGALPEALPGDNVGFNVKNVSLNDVATWPETARMTPQMEARRLCGTAKHLGKSRALALVGGGSAC